MSFRPAVALDCAVVIGKNGKFLPAQIAIVDENGNALYETYVRQPPYCVADYKTEITGVRESHLRNGGDLKDVRKAVASSIQYRLLVGHGLWNTLKYLGIRHPAWDKRDTAEYFKTDHGYQKLKHLASEHGLSTQNGDRPDALERARTCMKLYKKFQGRWEQSRWKVPEHWVSITNELEDDRDLQRHRLLEDEWGDTSIQYMERRRRLADGCCTVVRYCLYILTIFCLIIHIFL